MSRVASCLARPLWLAASLAFWPAWALGAPAPAPAPLPSKYRAVAVLPLEFYDIDEEVVQGIEQAMLTEIDEIPGLQAISPRDLRADLRKYNLESGACEHATSCLANAGRYGRAHLVLELRLSGLGGTQNIAARLIDTQTHAEITRLAEPLEEDTKARPQQLHRLAVQLFRPDEYVGSLTVTCPTDGAEVYLDDFLLGTTPLSTRDHIRAGLHVLRLSKPGYSDINRFVDVIYNRSSTILADFSGNDAAVAIDKISETGFGELWVATEEVGVEVRVDGEPVGTTPMQKAMAQIPAGTRHLTLRHAGHPPSTADITIRPSQRLDLFYETSRAGARITQLGYQLPTAVLPDASHLAQARTEQASLQETWPTWRFWTGAGTGVVGLAALTLGGIYGHDVATDSDQVAQINQALQSQTFSATDYEQQRLRLEQLNHDGAHAQTMEWVMLGVGIAATGAGAGLMAWDMLRSPRVPAPVALLPWWLPQGAGLTLRAIY